MRLRLAAATAAIALVGGLAWAATPDEIIAQRQAGYKHIGEIVDAMKKSVQGGTEVTGYAAPAKEIADWGRKLVSLFPPGTEKGHDTKARPEIWINRADFDAKAADMVVEADKLSTVAASGDKAAFEAQFKAMGGKCFACHQNYRYKS